MLNIIMYKKMDLNFELQYYEIKTIIDRKKRRKGKEMDGKIPGLKLKFRL